MFHNEVHAMKKDFSWIFRPFFAIVVAGLFLVNASLNAQEKPAWRPFRICVMDFSTADTEGGKRFLNHLNQPIELPAQASIATTDPSLQALQGMITVWEAAKNADEKRASTRSSQGLSRTGSSRDYRAIILPDLGNTMTYSSCRKGI